MTRSALVTCGVLGSVLTALTTFTLAWGAVLRCSGDTDERDPSCAPVLLYSLLDAVLP